MVERPTAASPPPQTRRARSLKSGSLSLSLGRESAELPRRQPIQGASEEHGGRRLLPSTGRRVTVLTPGWRQPAARRQQHRQLHPNRCEDCRGVRGTEGNHVSGRRTESETETKIHLFTFHDSFIVSGGTRFSDSSQASKALSISYT